MIALVYESVFTENTIRENWGKILFLYTIFYSILLTNVLQVVNAIEVCSVNKINMKAFTHFNCRNTLYPRSNISRFPVPDDLVSWNKNYKDYNPPNHTSNTVSGQVWADPEIDNSSFKPKWHRVDGKVNRLSFVKPHYEINNGYPLNPIGRTGIKRRGLLGRWGPNHAADPIVTRWKRDEDGRPIENTQSHRKILQMVAIQRRDNQKWAIPGGMVDPGELVTATLKREFSEEALNRSKDSLSQEAFDAFFTNGDEIYKGYVDDFRNTDNAWIETVAYNFHDDDGTNVGKLNLVAGDDAAHVRWMDLDRTINLHANHADIIAEVAKLRDAHW